VALITVGAVEDFSVAPGASLRHEVGEVRGISSARVLSNTFDSFPDVDFEYGVSKKPRGLGLQSLRLEKDAQVFLKRLFHKTTKLYLLAWAWDLSGAPLYMYPDSIVGAPGCVIPLKSNAVREFLGSGALLFPPRPVTSGLQLRIQIWESRAGVRAFGEAMSAVATAVDGSDLNKILTGLAMVGGPVPMTIAAVKEASVLLASIIGPILKSYGDEVLDFYEGNFPALKPWPRKPSSYRGLGTSIALSHLN
jgi:hypothetical protein